MSLTVEITAEGFLKVKTPESKQGDEIILETHEPKTEYSGKGKWSEIEKIAKEADKLDFPRRSYKEILGDRYESDIENSRKGKWSIIEKYLEEIDAHDYPRMTNEEILDYLHKMRGYE